MKIAIISSDRTMSTGAAANLGDAFLSDALAQALRARGHTVAILDFGSVQRTVGPVRVAIRGAFGLVAALRRCDALIIGGGTLFQDDQSHKLIGGLPRLLAVSASLARLLRRPIAFYGVGCDPVTRFIARGLLQVAAGRSDIWARDEASQDRLAALLGREVHLGADASLLHGQQQQLPHHPANKALIALNRTEASKLTEACLISLREVGLKPEFLAMEQQPDGGDDASLDPHVRAQLSYVPEELQWTQALDTIAGSRVVLASRMHALYMAALAGVPAVAIGSRPKVVAFATEFGIPLMESVTNLADLRLLPRAADGEALRVAVVRASESLDALVSRIGDCSPAEHSHSDPH